MGVLSQAIVRTGPLVLAVLAAVIIGSALSAHGAPFLVCDPQPGTGVEWYVVSGLPDQVNGSRVAVDATGTFGFKLDLALIPSGTYTAKAKACKQDAMWGEVCSADSLPFVFSRPTPPTSPQNQRLAR